MSITKTSRTTSKVATKPERRSDGFAVVASDQPLGLNLPQKLGKALWAPMLVMAVMAFPVALILGIVRADAVSAGDTATAAQLQHVTSGVMFIGFVAVFSAITFAIARILGTFREGGGQVQHAGSGHVQTLRMPAAAKGMILLMAMGMMAILAAVILHFYAAGAVVGASEAALASSDRWFVALEGLRRLGVGTYLVGIVLGLGAIIHVLRFQSVRVLELVNERRASPQN